MQLVKKGDAGLTVTPAEIDLAPLDPTEKIDEAGIHIFEETTVGVDLVHQLLDAPELADHGTGGCPANITMDIVENVFQLRTRADNAGAPLLQFCKERFKGRQKRVRFVDGEVTGAHQNSG
jgi:hypothetical protein